MTFVQFSGVTYHDPNLAYGSFVLYIGADGVTRLIDLNGVVRNEWPSTTPSLMSTAKVSFVEGRQRLSSTARAEWRRGVPTKP